MQSEKPEPVKWDPTSHPVPEGSESVPEEAPAAIEPGTAVDPAAQSQPTRPAQDEPVLEVNGVQGHGEARPAESMFQRPSPGSMAESGPVDAPVDPSPQGVMAKPVASVAAEVTDINPPVPPVTLTTHAESAGTMPLPRSADRPTAHQDRLTTPLPTSTPRQSTARPAVDAGPKKPKGLLDLAPSEKLIREVDSGDDGRFVLTNMRLIYQGRSSEGALFAAAAVADVTSIEFGRRSRDSRSAWWGIIGMLAAIAVWQVTSNENVGAIAGAVVAGISALLLADYWFRPPGLVLRFGTAGGPVEGAVSGKRVREAEELASEVQQLRQSANGMFGQGTGRPPGGSPGLY